MEKRALGQTGLDVSILGFGASSLGGVFHPITTDECVATVQAALEGGINFLDVSPAYGDTLAETNLGLGLRGVDRDSYILATKVGSYCEATNDYDYTQDRTLRSIEGSLERLGTDRVDLIQCHDIEFADHDVILGETVPTLADLKRQGVVGHIGITGLPLKIFRSILDRSEPGLVETVLSFCHYALNDTSLETLLPYFAEKGVGVINASPTGMGLLTPQGGPDWHPAPAVIQETCARAAKHCEERGESIVRLALRFAVDRDEIATTLVGAATPDRIRDNIRFVSEPVNEQLMAEVRDILRPIHNFNYTRGLPEHRDQLVDSL